MHCLQQNLSNLNEILHQGIMQCNMNDLMSFFMAAFWKHVAAEYDNPNLSGSLRGSGYSCQLQS